MKIINIKSIHDKLFGRKEKPTDRTIRKAHQHARKLGLALDHNGRGVAPWLPSAPLLPNNRHGRWEKGRIVPRKRA